MSERQLPADDRVPPGSAHGLFPELTRRRKRTRQQFQGSQFTSDPFTDILITRDITISMDGKGAWRDNVFVERFWRTLKYEEVYLKAYESVAEARSSIGCYLEFYNTRRPHSALDRRTPDQAYYGSLPLCVAAKRAQRGSACKLTRAA